MESTWETTYERQILSDAIVSVKGYIAIIGVLDMQTIDRLDRSRSSSQVSSKQFTFSKYFVENLKE